MSLNTTLMRSQRKRACDFIQTFCKHTKGELAGEPFVQMFIYKRNEEKSILY